MQKSNISGASLFVQIISCSFLSLIDMLKKTEQMEAQTIEGYSF